MNASLVRAMAHECGFELAGIAAAEPSADLPRYREWLAEGMAGEMTYLEGRRAEARTDPRRLLASARSILCFGKLYNHPGPSVADLDDPARGWISRYAWGDGDYHDVVRAGLERLVARLRQIESFDWKISVDTAPLLERSYARAAGLGWIGKNTCLINEPLGSWFFLGEVITSLELEPDVPPPDRCGSCTRCIDACPTRAIVPRGGGYALDARRCISYLTIELRGPIPEEYHRAIGPHIFGCDICQDVCPWNRRAPYTGEPAFAPRHLAPALEELAHLTPDDFRTIYEETAVSRAKHDCILRNVAVASANIRGNELAAPPRTLEPVQTP